MPVGTGWQGDYPGYWTAWTLARSQSRIHRILLSIEPQLPPDGNNQTCKWCLTRRTRMEVLTLHIHTWNRNNLFVRDDAGRSALQTAKLYAGRRADLADSFVHLLITKWRALILTSKCEYAESNIAYYMSGNHRSRAAVWILHVRTCWDVDTRVETWKVWRKLKLCQHPSRGRGHLAL